MRLLHWLGQRYSASRSTDKGLSHGRQLSLARSTWPAKLEKSRCSRRVTLLRPVLGGLKLGVQSPRLTRSRSPLPNQPSSMTDNSTPRAKGKTRREPDENKTDAAADSPNHRFLSDVEHYALNCVSAGGYDPVALTKSLNRGWLRT